MKYKEFIEKVNNLEKECATIDARINQTFIDYAQELTDKFSQFKGKYVEVECEGAVNRDRYVQKGFFDGFTFEDHLGTRFLEIVLYKQNKDGSKSKNKVPSWVMPCYLCNIDTLTIKEV